MPLHTTAELADGARATGRDREDVLELCVALFDIAHQAADEMRAARAARGEDITRDPRKPDIAQRLFNDQYDCIIADMARGMTIVAPGDTEPATG